MIRVIILFVVSVACAFNFHNNTVTNLLNLKPTLFRTTNENIKSTLNKLFTSLRLDKKFSKGVKRVKLLEIHKNFTSTAESYFKTYQDIELAVKVSGGYKTENGLFNLSGIMHDVVQTESLISSKMDKLQNKAKQYNDTEKAPEDKSSEFSMDSLVEFVAKIDNLTADDTAPSSNRTESRSRSEYFRRNLKAWRASDTNEENVSISRRIFKGKQTSINSYPFTVSVHVVEEFMCAGCIISKDFVITAATCLQASVLSNTYSLSVRVGSHYTSVGGDIIPIAEVIFHPSFDPEFFANNLALSRLKEGLHFRNKKMIRRIDIAPREDDKTPVTILGWGDKDVRVFDKTAPLSVAHLKLYDLKACKDIYSRNYVTETNFCAGFAAGGAGACRRDVGSPAIIKNALVGVVSYGPPICGTPEAPTVFTDLRFYIDWIKSVVNLPTKKTEPITFSTSTPNADVLIGLPSNDLRAVVKSNITQGLKILGNLLDKLINVVNPVDDIYDVGDDDFHNELFDTSKSTTVNPLFNESVFNVTRYVPTTTTTKLISTTIQSAVDPLFTKELETVKPFVQIRFGTTKSNVAFTRGIVNNTQWKLPLHSLKMMQLGYSKGHGRNFMHTTVTPKYYDEIIKHTILDGGQMKKSQINYLPNIDTPEKRNVLKYSINKMRNHQNVNKEKNIDVFLRDRNKIGKNIHEYKNFKNTYLERNIEENRFDSESQHSGTFFRGGKIESGSNEKNASFVRTPKTKRRTRNYKNGFRQISYENPVVETPENVGSVSDSQDTNNGETSENEGQFFMPVSNAQNRRKNILDYININK